MTYGLNIDDYYDLFLRVCHSMCTHMPIITKLEMNIMSGHLVNPVIIEVIETAAAILVKIVISILPLI